MDEIIKKIIDIENNAKEVYNNALEREKQILASAHREIQEKEIEIKETSDKRIMQLTEQSRRDVEERINRIQNRIEEKIRYMEQWFTENEQMLVETIFKKVIGD